ncbi:MAG: LapA family protein [Rhodobiaceae bacterium]|nr:LapA family protein [Rhodobiaceae bacterium]MCC0017118.1 LapA family protein [Rhodobiaceae bacterium]MCC0041948.1 LapA family protein [Rhodobiaceae bacterium]
MLRRIVSLVVLLPLAIVLVAFTVANRHLVVVSLDPFGGNQPAFGVEMPVYLLVFASLLAGVVLGGAATWLSQGAWRRRARQNRTEAARARREAEDLRREADAAHVSLPAPGRSS